MAGEKTWYDLAQEIFERVLTEADAEGGSDPDDHRRRRFITIRPEPRPHIDAKLQRLLPQRIKLIYNLSPENWEDGDEDAEEQVWEAQLLLMSDGVPQMIYRNCENTLKKILSNRVVTDNEGNKKSLLDTLPPEVRAEILETYARDAMEIYFSRIREKVEMSLFEHFDETNLLAMVRVRADLTEMMEEAGVAMIRNPNEDLEDMNRLLASMAAVRRRFLKEDISAHLGIPDFVELALHYNKVLPVWRDAKSLYKQNCSRANWRDLIRVAHPDFEFDEDLLSRMSGKLNDLPEEILAKLSEKGGDPKPSSIALEHAARLCGAPPYQYSLRHLYNIKREMERRGATYDEEYEDAAFTEKAGNG